MIEDAQQKTKAFTQVGHQKANDIIFKRSPPFERRSISVVVMFVYILDPRDEKSSVFAAAIHTTIINFFMSIEVKEGVKVSGNVFCTLDV